MHLVRDCFRSGLLLFGNAIIVILLPALWGIRKLRLLYKRSKPLSVWTGAPILTVAKNCKAERLLGINAVSLVKTSYYITDEFDYNLSRLVGGNRTLIFVLTFIAFLLITVNAVQVHAYVDGGVLHSLRRRCFSRLELFAYRFLGINLLIWAYGADVRTRAATLMIGEPNCCTNCTQVGVACVCDSSLFMDNYAHVARLSKKVFSMGDMIEYTPGSRNDLFFWPIDLAAENGERYRPEYPIVDIDRSLRVVHAPNHREFKGSSYLERAISELRLEGMDVELVLVERRSNKEALEIYRSADVIFDQCLIGFHGYFALEAMALGKPVMCFIRKPEEYLLHPEECPLINIHITTLKDDLRRVVSQRDQLDVIGRRGRSYIEKHFSLEAFAKRLGQAYEDLEVYK